MKSKEQILELHFGSDFYKLKEDGSINNILAAMEEYKNLCLQEYIKEIEEQSLYTGNTPIMQEWMIWLKKQWKY